LLIVCADGPLRITRLQMPGGKPLLVSDWLNAGKRDIRVGGELLGPPPAA
jgi:methionyl-tRNA formyltransferase